MLMTGGDPACNHRLVALEINQIDVGTIADQNVAIPALERRASNNAVPAFSTTLVDPGGDRFEPRQTVRVGEWNAVVHFLDISGRMKPIGIFVFPMQPHSEKGADGRFSGPETPMTIKAMGLGDKSFPAGTLRIDIIWSVPAPQRDP